MRGADSLDYCNECGIVEGNTHIQIDGAVQDDMINDLVQAIIDTVEQNVTVEYDENEDGKFTYANVDTPNIREMLKDDIAEYILERRR